MSGNAASAGVHAKAAIEIAVDIINNAHPELGNFPLAKNAGLAGLGGAKVEVVFADNQGSPATGQNQALRLITEEKVVALTGAYQSGITLTTSAIAEKYGIPFLNGESVAANLTERGFKWFFRTTPVASDFAKIYYDFLKDMKAAGAKTDNVALVHDNTEYGTSVASVITSVFKEKGQAARRYRLCRQRHRRAEPGAAAQGEEARRRDHDRLHLGRDPVRQDHAGARLQAADDDCRRRRLFRSVLHQGGRQDFAGRVQPLVVERRPSGLADGPHRRDVQEEERRRDGRYRRAPDAGLLRAVEAIDRAGSTDPAKIQAALKATDLKPDQLMMGYKGVKFDDKGQNVLAAGVIIQLQDGENYVAVWPKRPSEKAPVLPYKGW